MTLAELLDELRTNLLNDRSDRVGGESDYLWSDQTLVRYINEAQRRFARESLILRDGSTGAVTEVTIVEGQSDYVLHEAVIAVVSARLQDTNVDIVRAGHTVFGTYHTPDPLYWDPSQLQMLTPGTPLAYGTDEEIAVSGAVGDVVAERVTFRLYPEPDAAADGDTIRLRVVRMPIDDLSLADLTATPEIPRDHHLEMLDWAAYLALRIVDQDAGSPKRALEFKALFEESVARARRVAMRKLFAPTQWGFGRHGFAWER